LRLGKDGEVYFSFNKGPHKIYIDKKPIFLTSQKISKIPKKTSMYLFNTEIKYQILDRIDEDGLWIEVRYKEDDYTNINKLQLAKEIEAKILNIPIKVEEKDDKDKYESKYDSQYESQYETLENFQEYDQEEDENQYDDW
jgi:hypothetical protein